MEWSEIIDTIEKELNIQDKRGELARLLGVRPGIISDIKNGKAKNPGSNIALLLINKVGINPIWLETGDPPVFSLKLKDLPFDVQKIPAKELKTYPASQAFGDMPIAHGKTPQGLVIPLLDQAVSAGPGKDLETNVIPERFISVPSELSRYESLSALPVRGDSMTPTLHEGDLVVCDSGGWDGDGVYVIRSYDAAYVKRVIQTSKGYTVISDNKAYPSYSESREAIEIIGKVRCAVVRVE